MKRYAISAAVAAALLIGTGYMLDDSDGSAQATEIKIAYGPRNFDDAMSFADDRVRSKRHFVEASSGEWLREEMLALALMNRFRLSGDHGDLDEARSLLEAGLGRVVDPAGPSLTRAQLALMLHDLDATSDALDRFDRTVAPTPAETAAATALRGDIAFQRGNLADAERFYRKANELAPGFGGAARLANTALWSGHIDRATSLARQSFRDTRMTPQDHARGALMLANFQYAKGDLDAAGQWIAEAEKAFKGFWLVEAYAAQQLAAEGDWDQSIDRLRTLARETREPEVIDALVGILRHRGKDAEADRWTAIATKEWDAMLGKSRAAYRLHAAEHHLDFGDPARALSLAREEVAARPFGEAIEVLASAYLANGKPNEALSWLEEAERRGFRAVSLDMARGEVLESLGRSDEAATYYERAKTLNPEADGDLRKLLRFGHY